MDPFVIYNPLYSMLRNTMTHAMYGKQLEELEKATEVHGE